MGIARHVEEKQYLLIALNCEERTWGHFLEGLII